MYLLDSKTNASQTCKRVFHLVVWTTGITQQLFGADYGVWRDAQSNAIVLIRNFLGKLCSIWCSFSLCFGWLIDRRLIVYIVWLQTMCCWVKGCTWLCMCAVLATVESGLRGRLHKNIEDIRVFTLKFHVFFIFFIPIYEIQNSSVYFEIHVFYF